MEEDSEADNQTVVKEDKRVSRAPLHLARTSRRNISSAELKKLVDEGHVIRRGRFTDKENKRLLKNWKRICKKYPGLNNPFAAAGLSYMPDRSNGGPIRDTIVDPCTKSKMRKFKIIERLAYKLDDRLICDIYNRAKKLIGGRAFRYKSRLEVPDEISEDVALRIFDAKEQQSAISRDLDISPYVLQCIKTNPAKLPGHRWTKEDDLMLELTIERLFNNADPRTIPLSKIDWKEVEKEMTACGLQLTSIQYYKRWYRMNKSMAKNFKTHTIQSINGESLEVNISPESND